MRKYSIFIITAIISIALSLPAFAADDLRPENKDTRLIDAAGIEHQIGAYFRTRAYAQYDFSGDDSEGQDISLVDTRTQLFYTAVISEDFKFVNAFEMDAVWGNNDSYGKIGSDNGEITILNSYVDFNLGATNFKVGVQPIVVNRSFLLDDDVSGIAITYSDDDITIPFYWIKSYEGYNTDDEGEPTGINKKDQNDLDVDWFIVAPTFKANDDISITPSLTYATSKNADKIGLKDYELDLFYLGVDVDAKIDDITVWFTGIYLTGDADPIEAGTSQDFSSYLLAAGVETTIEDISLHSEIFYASGDDNDDDSDIEDFVGLSQDYTWAEIMGEGIFDNQVSNNSPGVEISNIMALNIGASFSPVDKVTITGDIWYAALAEDDVRGEDELGTEIDLVASYEILDGLNLDIVAAYLFAGDATTEKAANDNNPYELGTQLSFKF